MTFEPSIFSLTAAAIYLAASLACCVAAVAVQRQVNARAQLWGWLGIAAFFALLIASRLWGWEELIRDTLKSAFLAGEAYASRRQLQLPLALVVLVAGAGLALVFLQQFRRAQGATSRYLGFASGATIGMAGLIALRIISFHATDRILYGLKLHWVFDIGFTLAVLGAAILTIRAQRQRSV